MGDKTLPKKPINWGIGRTVKLKVSENGELEIRDPREYKEITDANSRLSTSDWSRRKD